MSSGKGASPEMVLDETASEPNGSVHTQQICSNSAPIVADDTSCRACSEFASASRTWTIRGRGCAHVRWPVLACSQNMRPLCSCDE